MVSAVFRLVPSPERSRLLAALRIDDDGSPTFEIGRPDTGATALLVDDAVHLPLLRSPTSARDLLPTIVLSTSSLGSWHCIGRSTDEAPLDAWDALHREACRAAVEVEPLPHLPLEALVRLHGWLLAVARTPGAAGPVLALHDGTTTEPCVTLPPRAALVPPVPAVLVERDGRLWRHAFADVARLGTLRDDGFLELATDVRDRLGPGAPIAGDVRVIAPVEIVDDESIAPP